MSHVKSIKEAEEKEKGTDTAQQVDEGRHRSEEDEDELGQWRNTEAPQSRIAGMPGEQLEVVENNGADDEMPSFSLQTKHAEATQHEDQEKSAFKSEVQGAGCD